MNIHSIRLMSSYQPWAHAIVYYIQIIHIVHQRIHWRMAVRHHYEFRIYKIEKKEG